jgi:hypothetical protein
MNPWSDMPSSIAAYKPATHIQLDQISLFVDMQNVQAGEGSRPNAHDQRRSQGDIHHA